MVAARHKNKERILLYFIFLFLVGACPASESFIFRVKNDSKERLSLTSIHCINGVDFFNVYLGDIQPGKNSTSVVLTSTVSSISFLSIKSGQYAESILSIPDVDADEILELVESTRSFTKFKTNGVRDLVLTNFLPDVSPLLFYNDLSSINTELLDDENEALSTLIKGVAIPAGMKNVSSANVYVQGYSYGILCRPIIKLTVEQEKVMRIIESHWKPNVNFNEDPFTVSSVSRVSTEESDFMHSIFKEGFHSGYHFKDGRK